MPEVMLQWPLGDIIRHLESVLGPALYPAFDPCESIPSPVRDKGPEYIKTARTVGINVRTIGSFWKIIPYALSLPEAQNAIHILPIWEPGVVASLYGPASWNINPEFFSTEMAEAFPHLDTVEKQLRVTVNLLHLLGKAVGMDVVPHTDRYSEMALANPRFFEWLRRRGAHIADHRSDLFLAVQDLLFQYLQEKGPAVAGAPLPSTPETLFDALPESERLQLLFGEKYNYSGRLSRRKEMVRLLYDEGLETVPATMGPPYRGIEVDPSPNAKVVDADGLVWLDYRITKPEKFSRVFGPLARYKLYESKNDNADWELDFERPNTDAWDYVCAHYRRIQAEFGFDFMRGDMSHVQMRPGGVPEKPDKWYDLLGAVKSSILPEKPWFGYFAESFLAPPGEMAYGDECDHLEAALADSTLGDLQSEPVGTDKFVQDFWQYREWLETRKFAPNFTIMTADKDDPRFDRFYLEGNEIRYFIALFLTDMPSYMGLGFECRDPHPVPAENEFYSKYYVFQMLNDPKTTRGPYRWGGNEGLYKRLGRQKILAGEIFPQIAGADVGWKLPRDRTGRNKVIAWTQALNPLFLFVANLDTKHSGSPDPDWVNSGEWELFFSTAREKLPASDDLNNILPGEGLVFRRRGN